ncbi:MAG: hypothetical protein AB1540_00490 [Bdellovibrionota bacterium]
MQVVVMTFILAIGSLALPGTSLDSASAADLRAPFDFETTAVLPKGVRNPRFKDLILFMDEKYGDTGGIEPLGGKLNKTITWQDVIDGQENDFKKAKVEGVLRDLNFGNDEAAGASTGVVNTYANVKVPVFAMGVTEKLTMAVAVPVVDVQVNADTGLIKSAQGEAFVKSICETDPAECNRAAQKLNDAVNTKLKRLGYEPIKSERISNIGDVKVVGKYRVVENRDDAVTFKSELTLPTGTPPNANKALDVPTGDGQADIGAMVIYDRFLDEPHRFRANLYAGYTAQLPDEIDRRIPESETELLSRDVERVDRDLGDSVSSGAALTYELPFGLNFGAAYGFQYMTPASYRGSKFQPHRYSLLSRDTRQMLHSATFGLGFSTVEMYRAKETPVPFQLNLAYCKPFAGYNVVKNDFVAVEVVLFF